MPKRKKEAKLKIETFEIPDKDNCIGLRHVSKLNYEGFISPGTRVSGNDIIIRKMR